MKVTKKNFILVYSVFVILLISVGVIIEKVWSWHNQQELEKMAKQITQLPLATSEPIVQNKYKVPECLDGHCPRYYNWSVKDGMFSQTLVIVPTAMNHGSGKLWIIDNGNVIFDSGEYPEIGVKQDPKGDGFYLEYATDIYTGKMTMVHYKYIDGDFVVLP